jgi:uncharacterized cupredoxin-like copper-binding protein
MQRAPSGLLPAMVLIGLACLSLIAHPAAGTEAMAGTADGAAHHAHAVHFPFGSPAPAAQAKRTVKIVITDVTFEPALVVVHPSETVRFVVTNTSGIDHEFTLGDTQIQQAHRKEMSEMAARGEDMAHDDPNAITVRPGLTRTLTWRFGPAAKLEFDCNIPGHYEAGMKGTVVVR